MNDKSFSPKGDHKDGGVRMERWLLLAVPVVTMILDAIPTIVVASGNDVIGVVSESLFDEVT